MALLEASHFPTSIGIVQAYNIWQKTKPQTAHEWTANSASWTHHLALITFLLLCYTMFALSFGTSPITNPHPDSLPSLTNIRDLVLPSHNPHPLSPQMYRPL